MHEGVPTNLAGIKLTFIVLTLAFAPIILHACWDHKLKYSVHIEGV